MHEKSSMISADLRLEFGMLGRSIPQFRIENLAPVFALRIGIREMVMKMVKKAWGRSAFKLVFTHFI